MSLVSAEDIIVSQSNVLWQKSVINNGLFWIVLTHYQLWGRVWEFIWTFFVVFVQYLLEPSLFKLCIFPSCTWQFYLHTWSWIMQDNILPKVMNPPSTHWGFWDFPPVASIFLLHCVHYWLSANATLWLCSVCLSLLLLGVVCPTWNTRHTWIQTIGKKKMKKKKNKPEYSPRQKWTNNPQTWFVILFRGHQVRFIVQRWGNDDPSWAAAVEMDANGHLMESKKLHWYMYEISRAGNNPPPHISLFKPEDKSLSKLSLVDWCTIVSSEAAYTSLMLSFWGKPVIWWIAVTLLHRFCVHFPGSL